MKGSAIGGGAVAASVPVVWDFLGFQFEAGPLVVGLCACLMTRLIVSLSADKHRWTLDFVVTGLSALVTALWVQAKALGLLPAGISGIAFGALGIGIIGIAKSQAAEAFKAALRTFLHGLSTTRADPDRDLLDKLDGD